MRSILNRRYDPSMGINYDAASRGMRTQRPDGDKMNASESLLPLQVRVTMDHELALRGKSSHADRATHKRLWKGLRHVCQIVCADSVTHENGSGYRTNAQTDRKGGQKLNCFKANRRAETVVASGRFDKPAIMVPPNSSNLPFLQQPTARCGSVSRAIDISHTDNGINAHGMQGLCGSLDQFHTRVDIADDSQISYILGDAVCIYFHFESNRMLLSFRRGSIH